MFAGHARKRMPSSSMSRADTQGRKGVGPEGKRSSLSGSKMEEMVARVIPAAVHVLLALENGSSGELKTVKPPLAHLPASRTSRAHVQHCWALGCLPAFAPSDCVFDVSILQHADTDKLPFMVHTRTCIKCVSGSLHGAH